MKRFRHRSEVLTALGAGLIALPSIALAQATAPPTNTSPSADAPPSSEPVGLADIVVTAQRREEKLQDIPLSVTAITGDQLVGTKAADPRDLARSVAGFNYGTVTGYTTPFLRGVGSANITAGDEASVATYVDGVYQASPIIGALPFNNVERIEVLKGPQGTLYGRNASGGLINIVTEDPSFTVGGAARAAYSNYDTVEASAYVNLPLSDLVAATVSGTLRRQGDGYVKNLATGHDIAKDEYEAIRGKLLFKFSDSTTLIVAGDYANVENNIGNSLSIAPGTIPLLALVPGALYSTARHATYTSLDPVFNAKTYGVSATLRTDVGFADLVSITAYRATELLNKIEVDTTSADNVAAVGGVALATLNSVVGQRPTQFTQEIQLVSNRPSPFNWIVGAYMLHSKDGYQPGNNIGIEANAPPLLTISSRLKARAYSAFAQGTYDITPQLAITVGLRYNNEHKTMSGLLTSGGATLVSTDKQKTFNKLTWRGAMNYRVSPSLMFYASVSRGFKSGLFIGNVIDNSPPYKPEILDAYEIGFKSDPARTLRINGAVYYYDDKNLQQFFSASDGTTRLENGNARMYGGELEAEYHPVRALTLRAGISVEHARYRDYQNSANVFLNVDPVTGETLPGGAARIIDVSGRQMVRAPDFTSYVNESYRLEIGGDQALTLAANYFRSSSFPWQPAGNLRQPSYDVVDGSLSFAFGGDRYSISAFAKNLTNEDYANFVLPQERMIGVSHAAPRTYGAEVGVRF